MRVPVQFEVEGVLTAERESFFGGEGGEFEFSSSSSSV